MKAFSIAFFIVSAALFGGCADPIEKPIGDEAQEKFKRGITGQGSLIERDPTKDPYSRQNNP